VEISFNYCLKRTINKFIKKKCCGIFGHQGEEAKGFITTSKVAGLPCRSMPMNFGFSVRTTRSNHIGLYKLFQICMLEARETFFLKIALEYRLSPKH